MFGTALMMSVLLMLPAFIVGQRQGTAAKGGSLTRTRIEKQPRETKSSVSRLRKLTERLELDFSFIGPLFDQASRQNPQLTPDDVIKANLIARRLDSETTKQATERLINELAQKRSLLDAVTVVFSLNESEAKEAIAIATKTISDAKCL